MLACSILGGFLNTFSLSGFYRITIGIFILSTTFFHSLLPLQEDTTQNVEPKSSYLATRIIMAQSSQEIAEIIQGSTLSKEQIFTALEPVFYYLSLETFKNLCQIAPNLIHEITNHVAQKPYLFQDPHLFSRKHFHYLVTNDPKAYEIFIHMVQHSTKPIQPKILKILLDHSPCDRRLTAHIRHHIADFARNNAIKILAANNEFLPSLLTIYLEYIAVHEVSGYFPYDLIHACKSNKEMAMKCFEIVTAQYDDSKLPDNLRRFCMEAGMQPPLRHVIPEDLVTALSSTTQSAGHFKENRDQILKSNTTGQLLHAPLKMLIKRVLQKEHEEKEKGRYVFFHAQQWHLTLYADIFKKLWEMVYQERVSDYQFLRFTPKPNIPLLEQESLTRSAMMKTGRTNRNRSHLLFMNHALFGNINNPGSCSYDYFLSNSNVNAPEISIQELFSVFNIETLYKKYQKKFEILNKLHYKANEHGFGNFLLISCTQEQIQSTVFAAQPGGYKRSVKVSKHETNDVTTILNALQSNPQTLDNSDRIEYCMVLTRDLALDPQKGPRIYSFSEANTAIMNVYYTLLDSLFEDITKEYRATNPEPVLAQPTSFKSYTFLKNIARAMHREVQAVRYLLSSVNKNYIIAITTRAAIYVGAAVWIAQKWDNLLQENKDLKETVAAFTKIA